MFGSRAQSWKPHAVRLYAAEIETARQCVRKSRGEGGRRTRVVRRVEPVAADEADRVRQNRPRHRVPTADPRARAQRDAVLRLQPRIQLQVVDVPVQLPCRLRDLLVRAPVLEVVELLEPEERAELVHRAHAPLPALHDAHDLDDAQRVGDPARTVRARGLVGRVLQDAREVVVAELAVGAAVDAALSSPQWEASERGFGMCETRKNAPAKLPRPGVRIDERLPRARDRGAEVREGDGVEVRGLEELREEVLRPLDVLLRGRMVPLASAAMKRECMRDKMKDGRCKMQDDARGTAG